MENIKVWLAKQDVDCYVTCRLLPVMHAALQCQDLKYT